MGLVLVVAVVAVAVVGPWFSPHAPDTQFREQLLGNGALGTRGIPAGIGDVTGHPLGGDTLGRDVLARLLHGGRVSLTVAFVGSLVAVTLGLLVGMYTGYVGGAWDRLLMRLVDLMLSLPFLLIAIAVQAVVASSNIWSLCIMLGLLSWMTLARIVRAKTQQVKGLEYVQAARSMGASPVRIVFTHVLPNVLGPVWILGTSLAASMILAESALSYLGLGVAPPTPSWGSMLREGQELLGYAPRLVLLPGLMILLAVFGFNLMGEGLRDAQDPRHG